MSDPVIVKFVSMQFEGLRALLHWCKVSRVGNAIQIHCPNETMAQLLKRLAINTGKELNLSIEILVDAADRIRNQQRAIAPAKSVRDPSI
jgi:antitoxin component of MazEF toxin-antitoxin module